VCLLVGSFAAASNFRAIAATCNLVAPVSAPIVATFREPECRWCAGKRGIEYEITAPTIVRSGTTGIVSFSGPVGGVKYVVVRTESGMLVTYGRMARTVIYIGDLVGLGQPLGEIAPVEFGGATAGSATPVRLYFGVRIGGRYIDPLSCLVSAAGGPRHAILIPDPSR
jgi:septal ring factor EnvC (AmiA/AmiB activator)